MPPFSGSLSADQRWDVIAYAWSLAATPDQIAAGKAVYQDQCAHCHGDLGQGDGKDAVGKLADLSDFAALAKVAPGLWDQALASGHVPSYAGTLSEDKRRAAIDYVRSFAYDATANPSAVAVAPATTPGSLPETTPVGPAGPIKIVGTIINGTAGQPVPDNLPMTLYLLPHQSSSQDMLTRTFQSGVAGQFAITETQLTTTSLLAVGVEYKDLKFYSEVAPPVPQVTLPITIYENTADAANVKIDTLHIVVEPGPTGLNVSEIYVISNNGDRFVAGFGKPVLHFGLPADATNLQLDPGLQQVVDQNGDGLDYYDAIPVGAQAQQLVYQYTLPLTATSLSRAIYQPIAAVNLLLSGQSTDVVVTSDQLKSAGVQTMPSTGQSFQQYSASDLKPGTNLAVAVSTSSQPTLGTGAPAQPFDWRILLGVGLVVVGVIGLVIWQRGQKKQQPAVAAAGTNPARSAAIQREVLIDQIAALDDDFAEAKLDEINYQAKRTKLKQQLMKLMEEE
jgi:mono/diheme cytochrome c family protein